MRFIKTHMKLEDGEIKEEIHRLKYICSSKKKG